MLSGEFTFGACRYNVSMELKSKIISVIKTFSTKQNMVPRSFKILVLYNIT
jgi:hypothetical protein